MQLQFKLRDDQSSKKFVLNIKYLSYDQLLQNKDIFILEQAKVDFESQKIVNMIKVMWLYWSKGLHWP